MKDPALVELQRYLHREIPMSEAMGVAVDHAGEDGVRLSMPLAPNLNHRGGLFGGSGVALAILAGWTLVHERLRREEGLDPHLVIQRSAIEYLEAVKGDVSAVASQPSREGWARFVDTFRRRRRARIQVRAKLLWHGRTAAEFTGAFVALERLERLDGAGGAAGPGLTASIEPG